MPWLDDVGLTQLWAGLKTRFARVGHKHGQADVEGLAGELAGKAASTHGHEQSQITGLSAALEDKAATSHSHTQGDVTGLDAALAGKAEAAHSHTQSQVTGLTDALGRTNILTYTSLGQIGLTETATISQVVKALPDGSVLMISTSGSMLSQLAPENSSYGVFIVKKSSNYRCTLEFHANNADNHYFSTAYYNGTGFDIRPWRRLCVAGDNVLTRVLRTTINVPTTGWVYSSTYDSYQKDIAVNGMKEGMLVYARVTGSCPGGSFPLVGIQDLDGKLRLSMADIPTRSANLLITGISEV